MPLNVVIASASRGRGLVLLLFGGLLVGTLPGCILSSSGAGSAVSEAVPLTVDQFATGYALPYQDGFEFYWYSQAPELHPVDEADVILAGTVDGVSALREMRGKAFGRVMSGWLTEADLRVICPVMGPKSGEERVSITYFTPKETTLGGLSSGRGGWPETLGRGVSYLLLLKAPQLSVGGRHDPPPIPLAMVDPAACRQGTVPEIMTALLVASMRAGEPDMKRYAIPVLGYLAHFHGQEEARVALVGLSDSGEEPIAAAAFRALTAWDPRAEGGLELLAERSRDASSTVSGAALAERLRLRDVTVFADLPTWCRRPGLPEHVVKLVGRELEVLPPQKITDELLRQFEELLVRDVPSVLRYGIARQLGQMGTKEVVPLLIKALDDPDTEVGYQAMIGVYEAIEGYNHAEMRPFCVGPDEFRADPQRIIAFWNEWWETASQDGWPPPPPVAAPGTFGSEASELGFPGGHPN